MNGHGAACHLAECPIRRERVIAVQAKVIRGTHALKKPPPRDRWGGAPGSVFPPVSASVKARPLRHSNHSNINSVRSYLRLEKRHFGTGNLTFLAARRSLRSKLDYVCIIPFNCTTHDARHTTHARQERSQSERAKGRGAKEGGGSTRGTTRRPRHLPRRSPATGAHRATARRARPARPRRRARAGS